MEVVLHVGKTFNNHSLMFENLGKKEYYRLPMMLLFYLLGYIRQNLTNFIVKSDFIIFV
jgi:hypothetical protein